MGVPARGRVNLIGILPVKNESWCIGLGARVALKWVDQLVVYDHDSTDTSRQIIEEVSAEHPGRVDISDWPSAEWDEMPMRDSMLNRARALGATHVCIIDADEILSSNLVATIRRQVETLPVGHILRLPGYNLRNGIAQFHANGVWGNRWFSAAFANDPRLRWSGDKFHSREPHGLVLQPWQPIHQDQGGLLHLWGASERRLRAKSAWYKVQERLRWPHKLVADIDRTYSWAIHGDPEHQPQHFPFGTPDCKCGRCQRWAYSPVPTEWWAGYSDLMKYLDVDAEPWQEAAVRDAIATHGRNAFWGLDLFGL